MLHFILSQISINKSFGYVLFLIVLVLVFGLGTIVKGIAWLMDKIEEWKKKK
jgi:hypothetical protein